MNHEAKNPDEPSGPWRTAAAVADVPDGAVVETVVGGAVIALARVGDSVYAVDGVCAHQGGPLGRGSLCGATVTCPWHGWRYDVTTGRQVLSETIRQRRFPARIEGDTIQVRVGDRRD